MKCKKLAIYVSSYDGCSDVWDSFFKLFYTFWPDCMYPIYLINNDKEYENNNLRVIHTGPEIHWFSRTIRSLSLLNEKYILFMLEDYFLSKKVNNDDIEEILNFMDSNSVYYYQLSKGNTKTREPVRVNVNAKTPYPISLQPAIWDRERLIEILKKISGQTPWDAENYFISEYDGKEGLIKGVYHDTRDLLGYKNGILRGKWILDTIDYYRKNGIDIETSSRDVMSKKKMIKYRIASFSNRYFPKTLKAIIKTLLRIIKIDYLK